MCLLTFFPEGVYPSAKAITGLTTGAAWNPDGFGYAMVGNHKQLIVKKGLFAEDIISSFLEDRAKYPDGPALFHSRIGTAGLNDHDNCHPFYIGDDYKTVIAHNGILPELAQPFKKDVRSDTRILAEELLPKKPFGYFETRLAREAFESWLGTWNKVVILTTNPRYPNNALMFNGHRGIWDEDIWWSNDTYLPRKAFKWTKTTTSTGTAMYSMGKTESDYGDDPVVKCPECREETVDSQYRVCWNCGTCADCLASWTNNECICYIPGRGVKSLTTAILGETTDPNEM